MYQEIELIGNVGKNGVELRYTPDGKPVANFSMAVNEKVGDKKLTAWFRISVWNRQAETCNQYLKTGSLIMVKGRLRFDEATGGPRLYKRQDGTEGASFEVSASTVRFIGGKDASEQPTNAPDEDIPF